MFGNEEIKSKNKKIDTCNITCIKGADDILSTKVYQDKISELKAKSCLSFAIFEGHYWHLIANLANYMQLLPDPRQKNYPMLHVALARAKVAFEHVANHKDQRFQYAYVALAMFSDLGVSLVDYDVLICDVEGEVLDQWHPFVRGLADYTGYFYKVRPTNLYPKALRYDANVILACAIMPEFGLYYLKEDPVLFSQWLRALTGKEDAGDFSAVLDTSKAFSKSDLITNLDPSLISADMCGDAEAFWGWLQDKLSQKENSEIKSGEVTIDVDAMVDTYAKEYKKDPTVIKRRLNQIRVIKQDKVKAKSASTGSMFFSGKAKKEKATARAVVNKSVMANKKYVKLAGSIQQSHDKFQAAKQVSQQKNQQTT